MYFLIRLIDLIVEIAFLQVLYRYAHTVQFTRTNLHKKIKNITIDDLYSFYIVESGFTT